MELKIKSADECVMHVICGLDSEGSSFGNDKIYKRLDNDKMYVHLEDGCGCNCMHEVKGVLE